MYKNKFTNNSLISLYDPQYPFINIFYGAPAPYSHHDTYGATFKTVKYHPDYYNATILTKVVPPWYSDDSKNGFMNHAKELNEPPVLTYKTLQYDPIPDQQYETYKPIIYEGFGNNNQFIHLLILIGLIYLIIFHIN